MDAQRSFGDARVSRILSALVRGLLWTSPFTPQAVAVAARNAGNQETTLLEETGVLLVGLQKYGPDFLTAVVDAYAAANSGRSLLQCLRATYDSRTFLLAKKLLDPAETETRLRELAGRLERLILVGGNCISKELVHELIMLIKSPRTLAAVNLHFTESRHCSLRDLVIQRCPKECAEILAGIFTYGAGAAQRSV